jgi:hypothetical protein
MSSRRGNKPGHSSFRKAHSRNRDRGPRRPRSRRFYPRGYRSSNPDTVLLGLAAVAVGGVVLVLVLLALAGRATDLGAKTVLACEMWSPTVRMCAAACGTCPQASL